MARQEHHSPNWGSKKGEYRGGGKRRKSQLRRDKSMKVPSIFIGLINDAIAEWETDEDLIKRLQADQASQK